MSNDALKPVERAALLLLVAVAEPSVTNPDLTARFGVAITGDGRRGLNDRKLVKTEKVGRSLSHEVLDDGWARAREELLGVLPKSLLGQAATAAINAQLHRYLARNDLRLFDIFQAGDAEADVVEVEHPAPTVLADRIRAAYWKVTKKPNGWVLLSSLREQLADISRAELDAALIALNSAPDVTFSTEANKKSLVDRGAAAVVIGNQKKHLIAIEGA
ncbi:hypothetical protein [Cryptosporangium arvum]|uniref:hypothetical protein n=1 Tax=Cryptosporangium arvum TaxID=80871 RepID=UPI0004BC404B|nr:hypothetical protein [Cryptosporangium arvum]